MNERNRASSAVLLLALFLFPPLLPASSFLETGAPLPPARLDLSGDSAAPHDVFTLRVVSNAPIAELALPVTSTQSPPVMLDLLMWDRGFKALPEAGAAPARPDLLWKTCYLLPPSNITSTQTIRMQLLRLAIAVQNETEVYDWRRILTPAGDPPEQPPLEEPAPEMPAPEAPPTGE